MGEMVEAAGIKPERQFYKTIENTDKSTLSIILFILAFH